MRRPTVLLKNKKRERERKKAMKRKEGNLLFTQKGKMNIKEKNREKLRGIKDETRKGVVERMEKRWGKDRKSDSPTEADLHTQHSRHTRRKEEIRLKAQYKLSKLDTLLPEICMHVCITYKTAIHVDVIVLYTFSSD